MKPSNLRLVSNVTFPALALAAAIGFAPALANADACVTASVATYTASGFSCSVNTATGPVTFSDITVGMTTANGGSVELTEFVPFTVVYNGATEYGLELVYAANTGASPDATADVAWTYDVSGTPSLVDAYASLAGTTTGTGTISLSEVLSNGSTLSLSSAGVTSTTFDPIGELFVIKDQNDYSGSAGSANTSILSNAFSVGATPVPEPASMGLLGAALVGFGISKRRRARKGKNA